ncbi:uncharacterized protein C19orf44 homolog [Centroberyx affinis]|uniref:uncharacterized protein C19orf44 homolog n=1 Tax=Centroberyx affinis TaxID=166261 RepID=UPI003A5C4B45
MWNRGGRSSALDRAQALLSGKRNTKSAAGSVEPSGNRGATAKTPGNTVAVGVSLKVRSAPPNTHTVFPDLSDLSSVSSVSDHGEGTMASAAAGKSQGREGGSPKDPRPQTSLGGGGGGSRFLKKAPPPAATSSQSPTISKTQMQQPPEPRCVSSSQRGSQSAALSRLALIEDRIRSRKESQPETRGRATEGPKPAQKLASELGISPQPPASQSLEASVPLSAQSTPSPKGKRFIKKTAAVAVDRGSSPTAAAAAVPPKGPDVSVKMIPDSAGLFDRSGAAKPSAPFADLMTKPTRVAGGVSLDSDEEDMRKLLGDSLDSTEDSLLRAGRASSVRTAGKLLSKSLRVSSTPPPAAVRPPSRSPASPPQRRSPFRFSGQARAQFSPSALSPSPSLPYASPSPPGRRGSPPRPGSPPRSLSSLSGHSEVLSLAELFPAVPGSECSRSERSSVSSEDFKINVMSLDDLVPVSLGFTVETTGEERETKPSKHKAPAPGALTGDRQLPGQKEKKKEEEEEQEEVLDYQSDFESESRTEPDHSASQVSERLGGDGGEEEDVSEVREEASESDGSCRRTEVEYSSSFSSSDTSRSYVTRTSDRSRTAGSLRRSRDSRSSVSRGERSSSRRSRRRASPCRALKEAAVQTQPDPLAYTWSAGMATMGPAVGTAYVDPTPVASHTVSAETVEALSTYSPAVFALNDMLRQQLALTRQFIESSRHLHSCLVQSLGPADYTYTTLEDTKEFIRKHKPPKLTVEEALEEVLQEMRDYHYI